MSFIRSHCLALLLSLSVFVAPVGIAAQPLSLDEATSLVRTQSGGRILSATRTVDAAGKPLYRFKVLLPNGHVKTLFIDPTKPRPTRR